MRISVTQEDIDKGKMTDCYNCPVALAVSRIFNTKTCVMPTTVSFVVGPTRYWYQTDKAIDEFIWNFDHSVPVQPFQATITMKAFYDFKTGELTECESS